MKKTDWKAKLAVANTLAQCLMVYVKFRRNREVEKSVAKKISAILQPMIDSANSIEECWNIFRQVPSNSKLMQTMFRKKIFSRIKSITEQEIESASTFEECMEIYWRTPAINTDFILEKAISLATKIEELERIQCAVGVKNKKIKALCFEKMKKI